GTRIHLLRKDPLATAQTTGSSRSARTPVTCSAFTARSSPSTPADFFAATLVINATSSSTVAMSSSSRSKLLPAIKTLSHADSYRQWRAALYSLDGVLQVAATRNGCVAAYEQGSA